MKKTAAWLCLLLCLLMAGSALAGTVTFGSISAEQNADYIDMGDQVVATNRLADFIAFLQEFPNLRKVDMFATQVNRTVVQKLEEALPGVQFGWTLQLMKYKNRHIVRTDAKVFSTLHGKCPNHNDDDFLLLKYCTQLLALDLGHNYVSDLSFLRNMPHLRVLILGENKTVKNIEVLGELKELEYLELFTCSLTDITPLTKLPNLIDLNLSNNKVADWRPLKEMKQLKRLWISGMCTGRRGKAELTAAERQELEEALPNTEIIYVGEPTQKGWRLIDDRKTDKPSNRVPHYAVIYEMFHTGTYIPFEESAPLPAEEDTSDLAFLITEDMEDLDITAGE